MDTHERFGWLDIQTISDHLCEKYPEIPPYSLRFTALKKLVESLPGFSPDPGHPANEKILETIQAAWQLERSNPSPVRKSPAEPDGPESDTGG